MKISGNKIRRRLSQINWNLFDVKQPKIELIIFCFQKENPSFLTFRFCVCVNVIEMWWCQQQTSEYVSNFLFQIKAILNIVKGIFLIEYSLRETISTTRGCQLNVKFGSSIFINNLYIQISVSRKFLIKFKRCLL